MTESAKSATGSTLVLAALHYLEVRLVFGLPGVHNLPLWRELACSDIRLVCVRHEQAAVYAADGYARASGRLGVVLVTTGPGAANTLAATGEAMASGSPVLILATDIPSQLRRPNVYRGVLHETRDQAAMFTPVTKSAQLAGRATELADTVAGAGVTAASAPSGPVYVGIPTDFLSELVPTTVLSSPAPPRQPEVSRAVLAEVSSRLNAARFPLIWAGGGALRAEAGALVGEVATRLAAPVITTYGSRGLLSIGHPCYVPGPAHAPEVGQLWDEADVVLAVGTDFDAMMTQGWRMPAPPELISINIDGADASKNYASDLTIEGDARWILGRLIEMLDVRPGLDALQTKLAKIGHRIASWVASDEPQAAALLEVMDRVVPPDTVIVADMCIPGYWLAGFRRVPQPRALAYPVGWGTLGFSFPASIGVCLASSRPTICVCGDGGFLFACGELATIAELQIPLIIVLVDDGGYGMLRFDQAHAGQRPVGVDLQSPDFVTLAGAFGITARRIPGFGAEFGQELAAALQVGAPRMLIVEASLKPPPNTSPRWYRAAAEVTSAAGA